MNYEFTEYELEKIKTAEKIYPRFSGKWTYNSYDISGEKYGRMRVLYRTNNIDKHRSSYVCLCDCGNIKVATKNNLISGYIKSCGCWRRDAEYLHKTNKYDLSGDYGIGYDSSNNMFLFDKEDYDRIKDYCWHKEKDSGYIRTNINRHKTIRLHDLIMNYDSSSGKVIDHIGGKYTRYDNRKSNLRYATLHQNNTNKDLTKLNTSGFVGVSFDKKKSKWVAYINPYGKRKNLGYFNKIEDAISIRKEAEEKYYGEYSRSNSIKQNRSSVCIES